MDSYAQYREPPTTVLLYIRWYTDGNLCRSGCMTPRVNLLHCIRLLHVDLDSLDEIVIMSIVARGRGGLHSQDLEYPFRPASYFLNSSTSMKSITQQPPRTRHLPSRHQSSAGALERRCPCFPINSAKKYSCSIYTTILQVPAGDLLHSILHATPMFNVDSKLQPWRAGLLRLRSHNTFIFPILFIQLLAPYLYARGYLRELCHSHCLTTS